MIIHLFHVQPAVQIWIISFKLHINDNNDFTLCISYAFMWRCYHVPWLVCNWQLLCYLQNLWTCGTLCIATMEIDVDYFYLSSEVWVRREMLMEQCYARFMNNGDHSRAVCQDLAIIFWHLQQHKLAWPPKPLPHNIPMLPSGLCKLDHAINRGRLELCKRTGSPPSASCG